MDNFEREFGDFVADYDVDVYDSADLGNGNFRFDAVIIKDYFSELKLKVLLNKIAMAATQIWEDCIVTLKSVKINSKSEDEYDFTFIVNFVDNSMKAETGVEDSCVKDGVEGVNRRDEVIITSDYSGDILDEGDCYFNKRDKSFGTAEEILEDIKLVYHVRLVKHEDLPQEFKDGQFYDPDENYYTDDKTIKSVDVDDRYYVEEYLKNPEDIHEFIEYFGFDKVDDFEDFRETAEEEDQLRNEDLYVSLHEEDY